MRESSLFLRVPAAILLLALAGCDSGRNQTVMGDYFEQEAGDLSSSTVSVDSVLNYAGTIGSPGFAFAGEYNGTSAFTVMRFSRPTPSILKNMQKARLTFTVSDSWRNSTHEYAIYATNNSWSDTVRIDSANFLPVSGEPLGTFSSSSDTLTTMSFDLSAEAVTLIKEWGTNGSFLLKSTSAGGMVNVYTCNSSYSPVLEIISAADTTNVEPVDMTYCFDTGISGYSTVGARTGVISDPDVRGFVLYTSFPNTFAPTSAINSGRLILPITRNLIPAGETITLTVAALTARFKSYDDSLLYDNTQSFTISSSDTKIEINLSGILGAWNAVDKSNFGLLFVPTTICHTPSQIVVTPPESFSIFYTALPEAK